MALFGLGFGVIYYEHALAAHSGPLNPEQYPNPLDLERNTGTINIVCKLVIMITTIIAMICLYLRQQSAVEWVSRFQLDDHGSQQGFHFLNEEFIGLRESGHIRDSIFTNKFIAEMLLLMVIPVPFYDKYIKV